MLPSQTAPLGIMALQRACGMLHGPQRISACPPIRARSSPRTTTKAEIRLKTGLSQKVWVPCASSAACRGGNPTRDNGPVEIDLVSYCLNRTGGLPYAVTVRDQLAAAANGYDGLTFAQWSAYYTQVA